jgi:hypothetical protein
MGRIIPQIGESTNRTNLILGISGIDDGIQVPALEGASSLGIH